MSTVSHACRDARAYIRPLGVHPIPWQCTVSHACHAQEAEPEERQGVHPTPWQCTVPRKRGGALGTPGRTSDPLQSTKCAKATGRAAETKGRQGVTSDPLQSTKCCACHRPRDTRASDPLQSTKCRACHAKASGDQGTPQRASDPLQSTKCGACLPCKTNRQSSGDQGPGVHPEQGRPRDARAYIRPLEEHQVLHLPRKSHRQSSGDQGTPGRTSDPLQSTKCCACYTKASNRVAETKGRQGVHRTPCRAPSAAPATQKPPAEQQRPRDARAYIRPLKFKNQKDK